MSDDAPNCDAVPVDDAMRELTDTDLDDLAVSGKKEMECVENSLSG